MNYCLWTVFLKIRITYGLKCRFLDPDSDIEDLVSGGGHHGLSFRQVFQVILQFTEV